LALTGSAALAVVATELAITFFGATLPTPLYPIYRLAFGFGGITLTLIYAVYVLGNLVALLFFGRLSDQIGRRPATLPAIGVGVVSTLAFLLADGTIRLFAARVLSGFATCLAAGAATAWIAELQPQGDKATAASIASAANFAGLALAPLLAGTLAQFAPWPLRIPYVIYLMMLIGIGVAILGPPETVNQRARRISELSLHPRLGVPKEIRLAFLSPAVTAFVTFALIGFYGCSHPQLAERERGTEITTGCRSRGLRTFRGSHSRCFRDWQTTSPLRDAERAYAVAPKSDASGRSAAVALDAAVVAGNDSWRNLGSSWIPRKLGSGEPDRAERPAQRGRFELPDRRLSR
jgi:MFS family permease